MSVIPAQRYARALRAAGADLPNRSALGHRNGAGVAPDSAAAHHIPVPEVTTVPLWMGVIRWPMSRVPSGGLG